jgi:hypothetical protein
MPTKPVINYSDYSTISKNLMCCVADRHRFVNDPDPDQHRFVVDPDPNPIPCFAHVGRSKIKNENIFTFILFLFILTEQIQINSCKAHQVFINKVSKYRKILIHYFSPCQVHGWLS